MPGLPLPRPEARAKRKWLHCDACSLTHQGYDEHVASDLHRERFEEVKNSYEVLDLDFQLLAQQRKRRAESIYARSDPV